MQKKHLFVVTLVLMVTLLLCVPVYAGGGDVACLSIESDEVSYFEWLITPNESFMPYYYDILWQRDANSNKLGAVDSRGSIIFEFVYDDIFGQAVFGDRYDDSYGFQIKAEAQGYRGVIRGGLFGLLHESGKILLPCIYEGMDPYSEGLVGVKQNGKWGYVDISGNIVIDIIYDDLRAFSQGYGSVKKGDKWGFVDINGDILTGFIYDDVSSFRQGYAGANKDGKWGLIDAYGNVALDIIYDDSPEFSRGYADVILDGKRGLIDMKNGNIVLPFVDYSDDTRLDIYGDGIVRIVTYFFDGRPVSETAAQLIDVTSNTILATSSSWTSLQYYKGYICTKRDELWGITDVNGNIVLPFEYEKLSGWEYSCENDEILMGAMKDGKWGYIDLSGNWVIEALFNGPWLSAFFHDALFFNGVALVCNGEVSSNPYFIDITGKRIMPDVFTWSKKGVYIPNQVGGCVVKHEVDGEFGILIYVDGVGYGVMKTPDVEGYSRSGDTPFTDVRKSDNFHDAVKYVYENNLFKGMSETEFAPNITMNRAMFVTVLGRYLNIDTNLYTSAADMFNDVEADTWYTPYIQWAYESNLIIGYGDGYFGTNDIIIQEHMYIIMERFLAMSGVSYNFNADTSESSNEVKRHEVAELLYEMYTNGIN